MITYKAGELERGQLNLGIDVGSTTVKISLMEPQNRKVAYTRYLRHNANQRETLRSLLQDLGSQYRDATIHAAVCGSGGKELAPLLGVPYVQELVANSLAIRTFYPEARTAIELGGQDAKIIFFQKDPVTGLLQAGDMRMNGTCAGGTGAFIDEVASILKIPVEEFESFASRGTFVHDISGRCGVFAKTDIQPLLNQGCRREDIALSAFHAIAKQTIGGLSQGLEITLPVIFEGGPLTFNPALIQVFAQRLSLTEETIIRPHHAETLVALGTALAATELFSQHPPLDLSQGIRALAAYRPQSGSEAKKRYFASHKEREDFEQRHKLPLPEPRTLTRGKRYPVYLGIDAGSTTSKLVLLDEDDRIVDEFYGTNQGEPLRVIRDALINLYQRYEDAGAELDIIACGTTGYGEHLFYKAFNGDFHLVETVAHSEAARKYVPDASFILDIGGQDMKAISITDGIVTGITVNEACSSGCGSFLENFAGSLQIPVEKIAAAAFSAEHPAELGSRCTVFMNSSIITEQKNGKTSADIMAGLCRSIIENVFSKVIRISNFQSLGDRIVVQGGTFKNDAVLRAMEQYIGKPVVRAPYPGLMGAIGTALLTKQFVREKTAQEGFFKSAFIGREALRHFDYHQESHQICPFCANSCNRTFITFHYGIGEEEIWVTGNRCKRGEIIGNAGDKETRQKLRQVTAELEAVPDLFRKRAALVFKEYPAKALGEHQGITIGLPRVLEFWGSMPFWSVFFRTLGFEARLSAPSSRQLFEKGLPFVTSDTVCFPAKLVHGHILNLAEAGVDRIFMPMINSQPPEHTEPLSFRLCPVITGYPTVIRNSDNPERRFQIPFDTPMFHWRYPEDRVYQICSYMERQFHISWKMVKKALEQGDAALRLFQEALTKTGEYILQWAEEHDTFAVVLAARYYQHDELVSHDVSRFFTNVGIPVLTLDSLPGIHEVDLEKTRLDITQNSYARLLSGAIIAAEHPRLELVQLVSFGCGHDALLSDEVVRLMRSISGKAPLILKLDESDVQGPLHIRIKSFIETVRLRRKGTTENPIQGLPDPYPVKYQKSDRRIKTILIPNVSHPIGQVIAAAANQCGCKAVAIPLGGKEAIRLGKKYVHNDICFPAQMNVGEILAALQSGRYPIHEVAVGMGKTYGPCRLVNYTVLARQALDAAGFAEVPLVTTNYLDVKNIHPGIKLGTKFELCVLWGLVMVDILETLRRKIRPYELHKGECNQVFEDAVDAITSTLSSRGIGKAIAAYKKGLRALGRVSYDRTRPKKQVFVTGEFFLNYHEGSNYLIEAYLENHDMEVILPRAYNIFWQQKVSQIAEYEDFNVRYSWKDKAILRISNGMFYFIIEFLEKIARVHPLYENCTHIQELSELSNPILDRSFDAGESWLILADILYHAKKGIQSAIILQPFGCLPNHICGRGMIKRIKELYPDMQILPLDYDPDTSFANIENRLQMLIMNAKLTSP
jgi:predicted CoA-substrate-specific enzyme activase